MSSRADIQRLLNTFGAGLIVSHETNSAAATLVAGPIDVFQIQIDTASQASLTSLEISDGSTASIYKHVTLVGLGTREVTFIGRPLRFNTALFVRRPFGDTDIIHITTLYKTAIV